MARTPEESKCKVTAQTAAWFSGRFVVPTALVKSPEDEYRAPGAKQRDMDALQLSLLLKGRVDEQVDAVLFVGANQALPEKSGYKPPVTDEEIKRRGFDVFFTIAGDHTQEVVNQLHSMFNTDEVG